MIVRDESHIVLDLKARMPSPSDHYIPGTWYMSAKLTDRLKSIPFSDNLGLTYGIVDCDEIWAKLPESQHAGMHNPRRT